MKQKKDKGLSDEELISKYGDKKTDLHKHLKKILKKNKKKK